MKTKVDLLLEELLETSLLMTFHKVLEVFPITHLVIMLNLPLSKIYNS
jgi:hypothetical protein